MNILICFMFGLNTYFECANLLLVRASTMTKQGLSTLLLSTLLLLNTAVLIQATTCLKTLGKLN